MPKRRNIGIIAAWIVLVLTTTLLTGNHRISRNISTTSVEKYELLNDGTLEVVVASGGGCVQGKTCRYFASNANNNVTAIRNHITNCGSVEQIPNHYWLQLLSNAAKIPYTMSCSGGGGFLQYLQMARHRGPIPFTNSNKKWSVQDLCDTSSSPQNDFLELVSNDHGIQDQLWKAIRIDQSDTNHQVGSSEPDDAVISFGSLNQLIPFTAYPKLLLRAPRSKPIRSIGIIFDFSEKRTPKIALELVKYLLQHFPDAAIQLHPTTNTDMRATFTRIMKAKTVVICGHSNNLCNFPAMANRDATSVYLYGGDVKKKPKVQSWTSPRLASNFTSTLTDEQLFHWLHNQDANVAKDIIIKNWPLFRTADTPIQEQEQRHANTASEDHDSLSSSHHHKSETSLQQNHHTDHHIQHSHDETAMNNYRDSHHHESSTDEVFSTTISSK